MLVLEGDVALCTGIAVHITGPKKENLLNIVHLTDGQIKRSVNIAPEELSGPFNNLQPH